jgi:predicted ribosomally synthesized peptide with nif11-like leader
MSMKGAIGLFERVKTDEGFRRTLMDASTPQEKHHLVAEAGYDVNRHDLAALKEMAGIEDMSDDELAQVIGGAPGTPGGPRPYYGAEGDVGIPVVVEVCLGAPV